MRAAKPINTWDHPAGQVDFFQRRDVWRRAVQRKFPTATITRDCVGRRVIYRAFYRRLKVGAFGQLRGFGYLTGTFNAELLHGHNADGDRRHRNPA